VQHDLAGHQSRGRLDPVLSELGLPALSQVVNRIKIVFDSQLADRQAHVILAQPNDTRAPFARDAVLSLLTPFKSA
jgi:hypothetical protein